MGEVLARNIPRRPVGQLRVPGQRGETTSVAVLLEGIHCGALLGDKAYDADWLRGIEAVIPPRAKRRNPAAYDVTMQTLTSHKHSGAHILPI